MSTKADRVSALNRQILSVEELRHSIPSILQADFVGVRAAENRVQNTLAHRHAAKFGLSAGAHTMRMGGVAASCTSGMSGLLTNWQRAARNRIAKIHAGEA